MAKVEVNRAFEAAKAELAVRWGQPGSNEPVDESDACEE